MKENSANQSRILRRKLRIKNNKNLNDKREVCDNEKRDATQCKAGATFHFASSQFKISQITGDY